MITIRPVRQSEMSAVKTIIYSVAFNIFGFDGTLQDSIRFFESQGTLQDLEDVQEQYFARRGTFLVAVRNKQIIGSGAIRELDAHAAELKRMWLLEHFQHQGIGYRMITELFSFARENGYSRVRLQTSRQQTQALSFYRKVGFYEIPDYTGESREISMEIGIVGS